MSQAFEAFDQPLGKPFLIEAVEVIRPEVLELCSCPLKHVASHQQGVCYRDNRSFLSFTCSQPVVERFEVGAFGDTGAPGGLA